MKRLDDDLFERIAARIVEEAQRRGISGAFAMVDLTGVSAPKTYCQLVMRDSAVRIGHPEKVDANFFCVVLAKIGMVITYRRNTGDETTVFGEVPFKGGRISKDATTGYAFSGATQDEDDELTQLAEEFHARL